MRRRPFQGCKDEQSAFTTCEGTQTWRYRPETPSSLVPGCHEMLSDARALECNNSVQRSCLTTTSVLVLAAILHVSRHNRSMEMDVRECHRILQLCYGSAA